MANVSPLNINLAIVTTKGTPTAQFMQAWQQLKSAAGAIPTDATGASNLLDLLGHTEGEMLRRGPDGWLTFTSPGGTTEFLRADGTWAVPAGGGGSTTLASLTDVDIPAPTDGQVLTYDAGTTKWEAVDPSGGGGSLTVFNHTADYTLQLSDAGSYQRMAAGAALNLTVPNNATEAFPIGTLIRAAQTGAGELGVVAGGGVTLNFPPAPGTPYGQGDGFILIKVATDEWDVLGQANAADVWDLVYSESLTVQNAGWPGYNLRNIVPFGDMSPAPGTEGRLTMLAGTAGLIVVSMSVGTSSSGTDFTFDATPQLMTFAGSGSITVASDTEWQTDPFTMPTPPYDNLLINIFTTSGDYVQNVLTGTRRMYDNSGTDESSSLSLSAPAGSGSQNYIEKIETQGIAPAIWADSFVLLTNDPSDANWNGTTTRCIVPYSSITTPGALGRLMLTAGASGVNIGEIWIGTTSTATPYDFDSGSATQITIGGSASATIAANTDFFTDPFTMPTPSDFFVMSIYYAGSGNLMFIADAGYPSRSYDAGNKAGTGGFGAFADAARNQVAKIQTQ